MRRNSGLWVPGTEVAVQSETRGRETTLHPKDQHASRVPLGDPRLFVVPAPPRLDSVRGSVLPDERPMRRLRRSPAARCSFPTDHPTHSRFRPLEPLSLSWSSQTGIRSIISPRLPALPARSASVSRLDPATLGWAHDVSYRPTPPMPPGDRGRTSRAHSRSDEPSESGPRMKRVSPEPELPQTSVSRAEGIGMEALFDFSSVSAGLHVSTGTNPQKTP